MKPLPSGWRAERASGTRFSLGMMAHNLARYIEEVAGAGMDDTAALLRMAHLDLLAKVNAIELEEFKLMATLKKVRPEGAEVAPEGAAEPQSAKPAVLAPIKMLQPQAPAPDGFFVDEQLRLAFELWQSLCVNGRPPTRAAMTPRLMSGFLRQVCLLQVDSNTGGFMVRVCGDAIELAWGRSLAGLVAEDLNQLSPGKGDGVRQICRWMASFGQPLTVRDALMPAPSWGRRECLFLPLGNSEVALDHVVAVLGAPVGTTR